MTGHDEPDTISDERSRTWEISPDLLSVIGADGRFRAANAAWRRVLGYRPEALVGQHYATLLHPDDHADARVAFDAVLRGEPIEYLENRCRHADGGWRWLSWVALPEDGCFLGSARDITEAKLRETRLAERNRIWVASRDLYVVIGLDGRYRELNPAWGTALGHDPSALVGTSFDVLVRPDLLDAVREKFAFMAGGGRVEDYEIAVRAGDGSYRWYSFSGFVEGNAILVMGRNIDERKRREEEMATIEQALRQSQKLEMIGQLTGGIAHDFNNLLMAMQSSLELLDGLLPADATRARELVGDALTGAARGAALTQRLLAFARKQELAPGAVDVARLVAGMHELLSHSLGPRVSFRTRASDDVAPAAVDGGQLEMALMNLALNARDAMEGAGELTVSIDMHRATGRGPLPAGRYVRVRVSDTGCGMDAATLERATEPFFTTKDIGSGTGLGLSMIHGLAEQSGGRFRLRSEVGSGTVAELLLPAASESADTPPPDATAPVADRPTGPLPPRRILLVDDDPLVLRGMAGILARLGHDVLRAESGALALQTLAREASIDIVITDQLMPGMTGLELATAIRRAYPEPGTGPAVVLATGYSNTLIAERDLVAARLAKPFDRARLEAVLASVCETDRSAPAD